MSSSESIQKYCLSPDLLNSAKQILKIVKDKQETFKTFVNSIATLLSSDTGGLRPNYCSVFTYVLRNCPSSTSASELIESIRTYVPDTGSNSERNNNTIAYILCLACVNHAGLLRNNFQVLVRYVQVLFDMSHKYQSFRLICYKTIVDISKNNIHDSDSFIDLVFPIIQGVDAVSPKNPDDLYLWTALYHSFQSINVSPIMQCPLTIDFFQTYEKVLFETADYRPSVHSIWTLLGDIDHNALINLMTESFQPYFNQYRSFIAYSSVVAIPHFTDKELIDYLNNQNLLLTSLRYRPEELIIPSLTSKINQLIDTGIDTRHQIIKGLLSLKGQHSFTAQIINNHCSSLSDDQTLSLLEVLKDTPFSAYMQLLWIQKSRINIKDYSILPRIAEIAAQVATSDEEKAELSRFIGLNIVRLTSSGHTWFYLFSGVDIPIQSNPQSFNELFVSSNQFVQGVNKVNELLNIAHRYKECEPSIQSITERCKEMLNSTYEHVHAMSKIMIKRALPYLDEKSAMAVVNDIDFLTYAIKSPTLCTIALTQFVENADNLPKEFWKSYDKSAPISIPISHEDALRLAPDIVAKCNGNSKHGIQESVAMALISMLDDDEQQELVRNHVKKVLTTNMIKGIQVISKLIKTSAQTSYDVLSLITSLAPSVNKPSQIDILRDWISECCDTNEIPLDVVTDAVFAAINYPCDSTASGKKKIEKALKWAQKLINKLERDVPRTKFASLTEKVVATGSRNAANMIRQLSSPK